MKRYFIGYLIQGSAAEYYRKITADLSEKFGIKNLSLRLPPHFTFKPPFDADDLEDVKKFVDVLSKEVKNLPIVFDGFGRFSENNRTIFLKVREDEELLMSVEKIVDRLEKVGGNRLKIPKPVHLHASIARGLTPRQSKEIWAYLMTLPAPHFEMRFDNITVFELGESGWTTYV
jgi:2'-5' RNA ligase